MINQTDDPTPGFGIVDLQAEHGLLHLDTAPGTTCSLTLIARTERGYPRREIAAIPGAVWRMIGPMVQRELARGMDSAELGPKPPLLRHGSNALSPLILREVAVLLWALMEDGEGTHIEALLNGWRQLAREERWWLYARASNPTQRQGQGWRRALYFALTDPADTRTAPRLLEIMEAATAQKKTSSKSSSASRRKHPRKRLVPQRPRRRVPAQLAQKRSQHQRLSSRRNRALASS